MELHAFERMAQELDPDFTLDDSTENGLLPQPSTVFPAATPPAMAYVPFQQWGETYDADKGLQQGTIFPVLDLPFTPEEGSCV